MDSKKFDSFIRNHYPQKISDVEMSDEALDRIMQLKRESGYTKVTKRISAVRCLVLFLSVFGLSATAYTVFANLYETTAYATYTDLYAAVSEKVSDVGKSEKEIAELADELEKQGYSLEDVYSMPPLKKNRYGQTYGPDALGAELIAAESDEGRDGYVYRNELEEDGIQTPEEAAKKSYHTVRLNVYKSDGRTVIGCFTFGTGK